MARGRGRGAGSRGRGASRGGRGGGASRGRSAQRHSRRNQRSSTGTSGDATAVYKQFDPACDGYKELFTDAAYGVDAHRVAQEHDIGAYLATMRALTEHNVDLMQASRTRCLAAAWVRNDHRLSKYLLTERQDDFDVPTVSKALQCLDASRRSRATEKKIAMCSDQMKKAGQKGRTRMGKKIAELKKLLNNQQRDAPSKGSVSGALCRHIRRDWLPTIAGALFESWAVHMSGDAWKTIADLCHVNPKEDMKQCPWFLAYVFGGNDQVPADSLAGKCSKITKENVNEIVKSGVDVPLAHLKEYAAVLDDDSKVKIAEYTPLLDTVIWEYESIRCAGVDAVISKRLSAGENATLPYGKLMERLLTVRILAQRNDTPNVCFYDQLVPIAEDMVRNVTLPVEGPVAVIGDASASMDVAIRTSTIIASFLKAVCGDDASLIFFSHDAIQPLFIPKNVAEVLDLAMQTRTVGSTCHASALYPYYSERKVIKTFFVVTDEEENTDHVVDKKIHYRFQDLFKLYTNEVYPARVVFVSFLRSQHAPGQMFAPMKRDGFDVTQFKLDGSRPDLSKLNALIGHLGLDTDVFKERVKQLTAMINEQYIAEKLDSVQM